MKTPILIIFNISKTLEKYEHSINNDSIIY